jgi:hypothetical protein
VALPSQWTPHVCMIYDIILLVQGGLLEISHHCNELVIELSWGIPCGSMCQNNGSVSSVECSGSIVSIGPVGCSSGVCPVGNGCAGGGNLFH